MEGFFFCLFGEKTKRWRTVLREGMAARPQSCAALAWGPLKLLWSIMLMMGMVWKSFWYKLGNSLHSVPGLLWRNMINIWKHKVLKKSHEKVNMGNFKNLQFWSFTDHVTARLIPVNLDLGYTHLQFVLNSAFRTKPPLCSHG